jgi:hypothetical protein
MRHGTPAESLEANAENIEASTLESWLRTASRLLKKSRVQLGRWRCRLD